MAHWTQTAEGKRKMALAQKKGWARRRQREKEASKPKPQHGGTRALVKEEINELARRGAAAKLKELEREVVKLRLFLGQEAGDV